MKKVNTFVLSVTIAIIDYLYRGRHFQRFWVLEEICLLYTSPSPRDRTRSRMPSSA